MPKGEGVATHKSFTTPKNGPLGGGGGRHNEAMTCRWHYYHLTLGAGELAGTPLAAPQAMGPRPRTPSPKLGGGPRQRGTAETRAVDTGQILCFSAFFSR